MKSIKSHRVQLFANRTIFCSARPSGGRVAAAAQAGFNLNKALDKAHESKPLKEICNLPPSVLQGIAEHTDDSLAALNINCVKDLGSWKYYKAAKAIAALASVEEAGARPENAQSNINKILKVQYEGKSIQDILSSPVYAFQGLTKEKAVAALEPLGVRSISDLAAWKYAAWAGAITTLSKYENADFSSR